MPSKSVHSVPRFLWVLLAAAVLCALAATWLWPRATAPALPIATPRPLYRPAGPPEKPAVVLTPDHKLERVQHKDATGLSPLEYVETPAGRVRIERTFSTDGKLLLERAFLGGKPVEVPRR